MKNHSLRVLCDTSVPFVLKLLSNYSIINLSLRVLCDTSEFFVLKKLRSNFSIIINLSLRVLCATSESFVLKKKSNLHFPNLLAKWNFSPTHN